MKWLELYSKEDTHVTYHEDDPTIPTSVIELPTVESFYKEPWEEAIKKIDGYGLHPKNQRFEHQVTPQKLKDIIQTVSIKLGLKKREVPTLDDIYDELETNRTEYADEIYWIKQQIKRRYLGYWFFNNGKPTYIDGWHYFFINFWPIDNHNREDYLGFYRDVDRRKFIFDRHCYTDTTALYKYMVTYRDEGVIKKEAFRDSREAKEFAGRFAISAVEPGEFIIEKGYRTCFGPIFPKRRRFGATSQAAMEGYLVVTERKRRSGGIQALTENNAKEDVFIEKLVDPWRTLPFFFRPYSEGSDMPKKVLAFKQPGNRTVGGAGSKLDHHGGTISFRASTEKAYDGKRLYWFHDDEGGKIESTEVNLSDRWMNVLRKTLAQGLTIHGYATFTSTFGEFEAGGGKQYFDLIKNSFHNEGDENGWSTSGLRALFIPAYDGYDGCIDEYGMSVIDDPKERVRSLEGTWITKGSKTILMNTRKNYERRGEYDKLNQEKRDNPFTLKEAATKKSKSINFNQKAMEDNIAHFQWNENLKLRRCRLEWSNGIGSEVHVIDDEAGRFLISFLPEDRQRNKKVFDYASGQYMPDYALCDKFTIGADPFFFDKKMKVSKKGSNGAIVVYYKHDPMVDLPTTPPSERVSGKVVMTYRARTDELEEYVEDVLKVAILYNGFVSTERIVRKVFDHFTDWKHHGYALYLKDEKVPGLWIDAAMHQKMFDKIESYIAKMVDRPDREKLIYHNHPELMQECLDINDTSEVTDYDMFAAFGYALVGAESDMPQVYSQMAAVQKVNTMFGTFRNVA